MGKGWLLTGATRGVGAELAKAVQAAPAAEFHR
jgi:short-subunit dehydrogenase